MQYGYSGYFDRGNSHHTALSIQLNLQICADKSINVANMLIVNFKKANFELKLMYTLIRDTDWKSVYNERCIDKKVEKFYNILNDIFKLSVPVILKRSRKYPVWYHKPIIDLIKRKENFISVCVKIGR